MSTPNYYSQMAPFWNWVAKVEEKGPSHPWFERRAKRAANRGETLEAGSDGMAHFWEFVSKVEEQGPSHPWIKRRAANQAARRGVNGGEAVEGNKAAAPAPLTEGETPKAHRHRHGHGHGIGRRFPRRQQAKDAEATAVTTSDSEIEVINEKTLEGLQSEAEKIEFGNETRGAPGARRGGRGGRAGRSLRAGKGRRAAAGLLKETETTVPVQSDNEKATSGDEKVRGPAARGGGRGGRGLGRGAGKGAGRGFAGPHGARGAVNGGFAEGMAMRPHAALTHHHAHIPAPWLNVPARGAGFGRGRGAGRAQNLPMGGHGLHNQHFANGPHRGPGALRGGPGGRGGRGMGAGRGRGAGLGRGRGAAAFNEGFNQQIHRAPRGGTGMMGNGPAGKPQNRGPNANRKAGPNANRRRGPNQQAGPNRGPNSPRGGPQLRRFGPMRGGNKTRNGAFIPEVDVYDHPEAFLIHASLPGANKEAVEVKWDAEKSALIVSGRIERQADEEMLKTLAMKERKVGPFVRRIRLGGRANPTTVDVDDIYARMEDGVLKIKVPKLASGFVEVKKVDIN